MKKNRYEIGQFVWFRHTYCDVNSGTVTGVAFDEKRDAFFYEIRELCGGTMGAAEEDIRLTRDELFELNREIENKRYEKYRAEITDTAALVRFMYDRNVARAEEYTDWEVRRAAKDAAREMLGIELDD